MIGVVSNSSEEAVVREFFELFKTPWEFYQPCGKYDVVLCAGTGDFGGHGARLVVIYSGQMLPFDAVQGAQIAAQGNDGFAFPHNGSRIPIYGDYVLFQESSGALSAPESPATAMYRRKSGHGEVVRVGFDLFAEVRTLLTRGQPAANAAVPALELHIAFLRDLILGSDVPLAEIPAVPDGYRFTACLTHDVDHPMMRRHRFDHTMFGFLYRATWGSLVRALQGRMPWAKLWRNWLAVLKLPLVHLGLTKDPWSELDRFSTLEQGAPSCFFVIPFKGRAGRTLQGRAPGARAARYGAADISDQLRKLASAGCEIGLHGIDAWLDSSAARDELNEIRGITGGQEIGVRMHWLYFDERSPAVLERAGASYDSTVGYNETIGYRAGTAQAYKPLQVSQLLELPLHVMDTALFFPAHLDLSDSEARERVTRVLDDVVQFGGCLTVNWHDRSIAPERLWDDFYADLIRELRKRGAWFATPSQAVSWFRKRRSAVFEDVSWESGRLRARIMASPNNGLPDLQLRVHNGRKWQQDVVIRATEPERIADIRVASPLHTCVASS